MAGEGAFPLFVDEDVVETGVGPAFMPVEEDAVLGMMVGPEVTLAGLPGAGLKATNRCFISLEVVAGAELDGDEVVERLKPSCKVVMPGAHDVASEDDAVGGFESPFLPVEGLVVAELFGEEVGSKRWGEHAAGKEAGFQWRGDGSCIGVAFAHVGEAFDDFAGEGGGADVKTFAEFFADESVEVGVLSNFGSDDDTLSGGKAFEGVAEFVGAFGSWFVGGDFSRRSCVCGIDGFELFCLVLEEGEQELIVADLLALGSVEALEQRGDDGFFLLKTSFK